MNNFEKCFINRLIDGKAPYYFPYIIRHDKRLIDSTDFIAGLEAATADFLDNQMSILKLNAESLPMTVKMFNEYLMVRSEFLRLERDWKNKTGRMELERLRQELGG